MNVHALHPLRWTTASYSATVGTAATDVSALGAHYENCNGCKGRWFSIECALEAVHSFVAQRMVTTLFAVSVVIGLGSLVL